MLKEPSAWSNAIMPQFSKWHRMTCRVVADHTHGMGSTLALLRLFPDPAKADDLAAWLNDGKRVALCAAALSGAPRNR